MAGTKIYFAPEIVEREGHNKAVDFWTLGVFLHELILLRPPFDEGVIIRKRFVKLCRDAEKNRDWRGKVISEEAKDIISAFLKVEPNKRLGVNGFD